MVGGPQTRPGAAEADRNAARHVSYHPPQERPQPLPDRVEGGERRDQAHQHRGRSNGDDDRRQGPHALQDIDRLHAPAHESERSIPPAGGNAAGTSVGCTGAATSAGPPVAEVGVGRGMSSVGVHDPDVGGAVCHAPVGPSGAVARSREMSPVTSRGALETPVTAAAYCAGDDHGRK